MKGGDFDERLYDTRNIEYIGWVSCRGFIMAKAHIDFGHGGKDPGELGNGLQEKDITLSIGTKVVNILKRHNVQVSTSRTNDKFASLSDRAKMANNADADVFLSIHTNAFNDSSAQAVLRQNKMPSAFCFL